jgi:phosphoglycerate kinase
MGLLVEREITVLDKFLKEPVRPFTVIMGGAKVEDKLELIESILPRCDALVLAGGLANSFLKVLNFNIGSSLATNNPVILGKLKNILLNYRDKIMLPLDAIVGSSYDKNYIKYKRINEITDNEIIYDIGVKTLEKYSGPIKESKTIFLNGTMGIYEDRRYSNGTRELLNLLSKLDANVIVGGGDSVSAVKTMGYSDSFTYLSTGGGATLEYLAKGHLIGIDSLMEDEEIEVLDV